MVLEDVLPTSVHFLNLTRRRPHRVPKRSTSRGFGLLGLFPPPLLLERAFLPVLPRK